MNTVAAGEFKQKCLRLLDRVRETGEVFVITKRGLPVAQLTPVSPDSLGDWSGAMRGTGKILGDLIEPSSELENWEAENA